jgi:hypothetical protein
MAKSTESVSSRRTYDAGTTARVVSSAGDATLSVADPSPSNTGHWSMARSSCPRNPTTLLTYGGPVSNDAVTVSFQQAIGAADALRTGTYSKTLTFTLSTTTP